MPYTLRITPANAEPAGRLIAQLDADLGERYPGEPCNGIDVADFEAAGGVFVVGFLNGEPVACGAIRPLGDAVEIKRMYVDPAQRGRGLARQTLKFLEDIARKRGFTRAVLETGNRQPEAIALYEACGWAHIPAFGQYAGDPRSVCFGKDLGAPPVGR